MLAAPGKTSPPAARTSAHRSRCDFGEANLCGFTARGTDKGLETAHRLIMTVGCTANETIMPRAYTPSVPQFQKGTTELGRNSHSLVVLIR